MIDTDFSRFSIPIWKPRRKKIGYAAGLKVLPCQRNRRKPIRQWTEAIHAQNAAYTHGGIPHGDAVLFFPAGATCKLKVIENRRYSIAI